MKANHCTTSKTIAEIRDSIAAVNSYCHLSSVILIRLCLMPLLFSIANAFFGAG